MRNLTAYWTQRAGKASQVINNGLFSVRCVQNGGADRRNTTDKGEPMASKKEWRLVRLTANYAIYRRGQEIKAQPITAAALRVLDWNRRNIAANDWRA